MFGPYWNTEGKRNVIIMTSKNPVAGKVPGKDKGTKVKKNGRSFPQIPKFPKIKEIIGTSWEIIGNYRKIIGNMLFFYVLLTFLLIIN